MALARNATAASNCWRYDVAEAIDFQRRTPWRLHRQLKLAAYRFDIGTQRREIPVGLFRDLRIFETDGRLMWSAAATSSCTLPAISRNSRKSSTAIADRMQSHAPFSVGSLEPQSLHVRVLRALERLGLGPAEQRTAIGKELRDRQQGNSTVLHINIA